MGRCFAPHSVTQYQMKTKWVIFIGIGCLLVGMLIGASIIGIIWKNQISSMMMAQIQHDITMTSAQLKQIKDGKPELCEKVLATKLTCSLMAFDSLTNGLGLPEPFFPDAIAKARELLAEKPKTQGTEPTNAPYSSPATGSNR